LPVFSKITDEFDNADSTDMLENKMTSRHYQLKEKDAIKHNDINNYPQLETM
jgi:hypothetical protein